MGPVLLCRKRVRKLEGNTWHFFAHSVGQPRGVWHFGNVEACKFHKLWLFLALLVQEVLANRFEVGQHPGLVA
jgi:hypothetical protein